MEAGRIGTVKGLRAIHTLWSKQLQSYGMTSANAERIIQASGGNYAGSGLQRGGVVGLARGGTLVGGSGSGDKVPAMLEPGEVVWNRRAVQAIFGGARKADSVNRELPRFAAGGIVGLGRSLQQQGYEVGEHPAFGGVSMGIGRSPTSFHHSNQAIDVNDNAPPFASGGGEPGSLDRLYSRLKKMPGVAELLWRTAGHFDHLHVALAAGAGGPLGVGLNMKLPRFKGRGIQGTIGARGLNQVSRGLEKTAKNLIAEGTESGISTSAGGAYDKGALASLWRRTGSNGDPSTMAAIALAESSGNPRADNGIARGLWQIIASTWSAYGSGGWANAFNPSMNAEAAHRILSYQGIGAWDVYDSGAYRQFMQSGGTVKAAKGRVIPRKTQMGFIRNLMERTSEMTDFYESDLTPSVKDAEGNVIDPLTKPERGQLTRRNTRILDLLKGRRSLLWGGLGQARRAKAKGRMTPKEFRTYSKRTKGLIEELQGKSGKGGEIFNVRSELNRLGTLPGDLTSPEPPSAMNISELLDVIQAAKYGVFDSRLPEFHRGGTYRAPVGRAEGAAILRDGETVTPPGGGGSKVVINIADGMGWLKDLIDVEIDGRARAADLEVRVGRRV